MRPTGSTSVGLGKLWSPRRSTAVVHADSEIGSLEDHPVSRRTWVQAAAEDGTRAIGSTACSIRGALTSRGVRDCPVTRFVLKDELTAFAKGEELREEVKQAVLEALGEAGVQLPRGLSKGCFGSTDFSEKVEPDRLHKHDGLAPTTTPHGLMRRHFSRDFNMQVPITLERERLGRDRVDSANERHRRDSSDTGTRKNMADVQSTSSTSRRSAAVPEPDILMSPRDSGPVGTGIPLLGAGESPRDDAEHRPMAKRTSLPASGEEHDFVAVEKFDLEMEDGFYGDDDRGLRCPFSTWPSCCRLAGCVQHCIVQMVKHVWFEHLCGIIVVINALTIAYESDKLAFAQAHGDEKETKEFTDFIDSIFCTVFVTEAALRIYAYRSAFWIGEGCAWNWFDLVMVVIQVMEQLVRCISSFRLATNLSILRALRMFRVIRIFRLLRVLHLFDELRVIVSSITSSTSSLLWAMVLLLLTVFVFSELFLQIVLSAGSDRPGTAEYSAEIEFYFGSLYRTFLTMFECIVGGISWDAVVRPLVEDISPWMGVAFCVYISTCIFAIMNLLTGIFVDKAMRTVREDKDNVVAWRIHDLFMGVDSVIGQNYDEEVTFELFKEVLKAPAMVEYFKQINVEVKEARWLFDLIDMDASGSLDSKEIVDGCLSLRGPARALELAILMKDFATMQRTLQEFQISIMEKLNEVQSTSTTPGTCSPPALIEQRMSSASVGGGGGYSESHRFSHNNMRRSNTPGRRCSVFSTHTDRISNVSAWRASTLTTMRESSDAHGQDTFANARSSHIIRSSSAPVQANGALCQKRSGTLGNANFSTPAWVATFDEGARGV